MQVIGTMLSATPKREVFRPTCEGSGCTHPLCHSPLIADTLLAEEVPFIQIQSKAPETIDTRVQCCLPSEGTVKELHIKIHSEGNIHPLVVSGANLLNTKRHVSPLMQFLRECKREGKHPSSLLVRIDLSSNPIAIDRIRELTSEERTQMSRFKERGEEVGLEQHE